ncbi:het domain protein [Seiridium cupressi]
MLGITVGIFDSTDPRDRIYALLGMPFSGNDPEQGTLLKPNYAQDIRSVYTQAVQRILRQDEHLRVLSSIHHGAEIDTSWPTWVPKWNESYKAEPLALREEQGYYSNAGELFIPDDNTFSPDGERIYLNGIECATVTEVGNVMTKHKHGIAAMSREKDSKALISKVEQYTIFGFSDPVRQGKIAKEGFKSAAAVGMPGKYGIKASVEMLTGDKAQVDHLVEFLAYWRERSTWNQTELLHGSVDEAWGADKESACSKEIWLCCLNTCWGWRVFHRADGKFGLGPAATKIGDRIVVLFGGIVPFVLRPADNGAWLFVGECFVPGLMQGESVEAAGLLDHGSFEREKDGALRLKLESESDTSPRFRRKVGENNIVRKCLLARIPGQIFTTSASLHQHLCRLHTGAYVLIFYLMVQKFLDTINYHYYILHPPTFLEEYKHWWKNRTQSQPLNFEWTSLFIEVCACAAQHLEPEQRKKLQLDLGETTQISTERYHSASQNLSRSIFGGKGGFAHVQRLIHSCYWSKSEGRYVECWHELKAAVGEAQELHMHREQPTQAFSDFDRVVRRRIWCILETLDWQISALLSRPLIIDRNDCQVELPSLSLEPDMPSAIMHMKLQCQLSSKLFQGFGNARSIMLASELQAYQHEIGTWMQHLPPQFAITTSDTTLDERYLWLYITTPFHSYRVLLFGRQPDETILDWQLPFIRTIRGPYQKDWH